MAKQANDNAAPTTGADASGPSCPFCSESFRAAAVARRGGVFAVPDAHPVADGHLLLIPVRHTADFFSMTPAEHRDAVELLAALRDRAMQSDPTVTGFTVGSNCGLSAGQQVPHAHIHFIPRRDEDGPNGRGVKGVIRNKITY
jgi:diadenosine tetraphosphate (Ap4A) HIT family hydrolase